MATETSTGVTGSSSGPASRATRPEISGLVLAAGMGTRLRPLTRFRPKPLCPVGNAALVDLVIDRLAPATGRLAVNVHAGRQAMEEHFRAGEAEGPQLATDLAGRGGTSGIVAVQLSIEEPQPLGTAGALGHLRWWIDGQAVLVVNGDTWSSADLVSFVDGWDGERVGVLLHDPSSVRRSVPPAFTPTSRLAATVVPWRVVRTLTAEPQGLYQRCLAPAAEAGRLAVRACDGHFFDCGTPASYLGANLAAAGGESLVAVGATVRGTVEQSVVGAAVIDGEVRRSVVWSGGRVGAGERLVDAIRTDTGATVLVR